MKCPYCSYIETKVIDSRDAEDLDVIRRRRECMKCEKRFTTYERPDVVDLVVIKKDGRREPFNRNKLLIGIQKACEKRPVSQEAIEKLVDDIERTLRNMDSIEVSGKEIGNMAMERLQPLDKVSYIRFASVYREFTDLESFEKELKELKRKGSTSA